MQYGLNARNTPALGWVIKIGTPPLGLNVAAEPTLIALVLQTVIFLDAAIAVDATDDIPRAARPMAAVRKRLRRVKPGVLVSAGAVVSQAVVPQASVQLVIF